MPCVSLEGAGGRGGVSEGIFSVGVETPGELKPGFLWKEKPSFSRRPPTPRPSPRALRPTSSRQGRGQTGSKIKLVSAVREVVTPARGQGA